MNQAQKIIKIGAICLAVAIMAGILELILIGINYIPGFSKENTVTFEETYINIKKIDIDLKITSLIIEDGEELKVEAFNVQNDLEAKNNNQTLTITEKKQSSFWSKKEKGKIKITIPKNLILEELNINSGVGEMIINNVQGSKVKISQGTGSIKLKNLTFEESLIHGGIGEMQITNATFNNLDLEVGVGKIDITGKILGNSTIECGVGELTMTLDDFENYELSLKKGMGRIKVDGKEYKNDTVIGVGPNKIQINGGIGNITIK